MELRLRGRHIGDKRVRVPTTDRSGERLRILAIVANKFACRVRPATCLFCLFISIEESPMQKILIIGYLGRDPELKYSPQGAVIAQFSIASTERWKNRNGELQA